MKLKSSRVANELPPRFLAKMAFRMLPRFRRRFAYGDIVEQYREKLAVPGIRARNAHSANFWLVGVIIADAVSLLPDIVRQFLIALAITAMMSA